jgi:hypothetical protein
MDRVPLLVFLSPTEQQNAARMAFCIFKFCFEPESIRERNTKRYCGEIDSPIQCAASGEEMAG